MFRTVAPGTTSRLTTIDRQETYGRHILKEFSRTEKDIKHCLDLGCGNGDDLETVKEFHPHASLHGVDFGNWNENLLNSKGIESITLNIEKDPLPYKDETIDLVIANQILEHTKEIYWINHEIFRTLKVGGHLYLGVPNALALHNRILGIFGHHPTCAKMISAHIRAFSPNDTKLFYKAVGGQFTSITFTKGAQFYPLPKVFARPLANTFPSLAVSMFMAIKKTSKYSGEFLQWPNENKLETNFYLGN